MVYADLGSSTRMAIGAKPIRVEAIYWREREMTFFLVWCVVAYLLVGLYMATLGPLGDDIRKNIREMKAGSSMAAYFRANSYVPPSQWKQTLFVMSAGIVAILGWGVFLPGHLANRRKKAGEGSTAVLESDPTQRASLMFKNTGGAGQFQCNACGYNQPLVAFLHGFGENAPTCTGYQCRSCRQFREIRSTRNDKPDLHCACGGVLTRDDKIVCPGCGSDRVSHETTVIT